MSGAANAVAGAESRGPFASLGRWIVRHPWYPIIFWIALLLVASPFLARTNQVLANSATSLPSSSPSAVASDRVAALFPSSNVPTDSLILLEGPNITGPSGMAVASALVGAIGSDPSITDVAHLNDLATAYARTIAGAAELVERSTGSSLPGLLAAANSSAAELWRPAALYVANWSELVAAHPNETPAAQNAPAYQNTYARLGNNSTELAILGQFYGGARNATGFGQSNCFHDPANVGACASAVNRATVAELSPATTGLSPSFQNATLVAVDLTNYTQGSRPIVAQFESTIAALPPSFLERVWSAFPGGPPSPAAALVWANATVAQPFTTWPLPVPSLLRSEFLAPTNDAMLVVVSYAVTSSYVDGSGRMPVYADVAEINRLIAATIPSADPSGMVTAEQTGPAALDETESVDLSADLAIVLPLTLIVLLAITVAYFRAPLAPLLTFGGLGIALGLGMAAVFVIGSTVTKVDPTALTLESTFVLGVGTDYAIFLVARYREELRRGRPSKEAVVTTVEWAGHSIATSGTTAILATLALAFSGVALLSQWGIVLSIAVLITLLIALTMVPAILTLLGPRVFWPYTGAREAARAERERSRTRPTYFESAGRRTQQRPKTIAAIVLVASIPLVAVALTSPLSFDFYQQLPGGEPATNGLSDLSSKFGPGYSFPTQVLVTFAAPPVVASLSGIASVDSTELVELGAVTQIIASDSAVAQVRSPVGPDGATLGVWLNATRAAPGAQLQLAASWAQFVGSDGRTLLLTVVFATSGLSVGAVRTLEDLENALGAYASAHPEIGALAYGGGASVIHDLEQQTTVATERLALLVSIGLIVVLLVVLRSYLIPLFAVATIGLSIGWAWGVTNLVLADGLGVPLFFYVPTVLFILILGLGIDYNVFLLTRVREEKVKGRSATESVVSAVAATGGIITAAAVILASAFLVLATGRFLLLVAIGFSVATAILLDAMVVRTYLVPSILQALGDRVWRGPSRRRPPAGPPPEGATTP